MSDIRPLPLIGLAVLGALIGGACSCENDPLIPSMPGACEPNYPCQPGFEYRLGQCKAARCAGDTDCCPGQKCNAAAGLCINLLEDLSCGSDTDCQIPGQKCIDQRGGRFCGYPNKGNTQGMHQTQSCATSADCDADRSCFASRCVDRAPCEGGCEPGFVCEVDTNTCYPMPECAAVCTEGQIEIVSDPDTMTGPQCCKLDCKCATLPPVAAGQFGWYAALAMTPDALWVSAYDPGYGDLVVAQYDFTGKRTRVDYVDGFPSTGPLVGDPTGARGGRGDPGPDVGKHTSIATDSSGTIHVAYYDKDQGALRYAAYSGGVWKTALVDDDGDTGYYTSIAIGPDGHPRIAYMMIDGQVPPDPMPRTALKLATASSNLPLQPSDWTTVTVDSAPKPALVCGGGCPRDQACVDLGAGPACTPTALGCQNCGSNETCVMTMTGTVSCVERINAVPLDDLIEGTGLFASLAFSSTGTPMIAYYDRLNRDLRFAWGDAGGGFVLRTLDGDDAMAPTDQGQHASLAVGPGGIYGVAYVDASKDDLVYLELPARTREIVDNGVTPPDLRLVGPDAALAYDDAGSPAIAYQDPTNIDLLYARRVAGAWSSEVLRGAPPAGMTRGTAAGFYVDQVLRGTDAFVLGVDVNFSPESDLLLTPVVLTKRLN